MCVFFLFEKQTVLVCYINERTGLAEVGWYSSGFF